MTGIWDIKSRYKITAFFVYMRAYIMGKCRKNDGMIEKNRAHVHFYLHMCEKSCIFAAKLGIVGSHDA